MEVYLWAPHHAWSVNGNACIPAHEVPCFEEFEGDRRHEHLNGKILQNLVILCTVSWDWLHIVIFIFILCVWMLACVYVCAPCVCLVPEARRGHHIPWDWSYRRLWAAMSVLGIKLRASACTLNLWAIPPALGTHSMCRKTDELKGELPKCLECTDLSQFESLPLLRSVSISSPVK